MILLGIGGIALIFFGDMWIKNMTERNVGEGETRALPGGFLFLRRHRNRGAMLNFGQTWGPGSKAGENGGFSGPKLVAAVSVALCAVLTVVFIVSFTRVGSGLLRAGLTLLLGGAFSNTYDRLKRKYVVDYVSFAGKGGRPGRIVFNLSDFCIITGALLSAIGFGGQ